MERGLGRWQIHCYQALHAIKQPLTWSLAGDAGFADLHLLFCIMSTAFNMAEEAKGLHTRSGYILPIVSICSDMGC